LASDLVQCPRCGLRQSGRHAVCARCEHALDPTRDTVTGTPTGITPSQMTPSTEAGTASPTRATPSAPTERPLDLFADMTADGDGEGPGRGPLSAQSAPSWPGDSGSYPAARRSPSDPLGGDRGSLGRRGQPAQPVPARPITEDELPSAPSWSMPGRLALKSASRPGDTSADFPPEPRDVGTSGSIPGIVIGRPQSALYSSEHSSPPEDPLLADLVAGRVSDLGARDEPPQGPEFGYDIGTFPEDAGGDVWGPERVPTGWPSGTAETPSDGPRVVAPSLGRRQTTQGRNVDPRGRSVASHPDTVRDADAVSRDRVSAAMPDVGLSLHVPPDPVRRTTSPSDERLVAAVAPRSRATPAGNPRADGVSPLRLVALFVAIIVAGWGAFAGASLIRIAQARAQVVDALDRGIGPNGPTADLPAALRAAVASAGVEERLDALMTEISGTRNAYRAGVAVRDQVGGIPWDWEAFREGAFPVRQNVRTLQFFVQGGWDLDETALAELRSYESRKPSRALDLLQQPPSVDPTPSTSPEPTPSEQR
jgi:hypothetical protein